MGLIYKLDFASGKSYIGLTTRTLMQRLAQHRIDMNSKGRGFLVHAAWLKHGEPIVSVIAEAEGEELRQAERDAIRQLNTISPNGYNLCVGGDLPEWSEETRKKMGDAHRGKPKSAEHRAKIAAANKGKTFTAEHLENMKSSARARDPKSRNDLSKYWVGKTQSEEHKAKKAESKRANTLAKRTKEAS